MHCQKGLIFSKWNMAHPHKTRHSGRLNQADLKPSARAARRFGTWGTFRQSEVGPGEQQRVGKEINPLDFDRSIRQGERLYQNGSIDDEDHQHDPAATGQDNDVVSILPRLSWIMCLKTDSFEAEQIQPASPCFHDL